MLNITQVKEPWNIFDFNRMISLKWILFLIISLRSIHFLIHESPPGADITLLGDMVRLYIENWKQGNGFPTTLLPLFGEANFFFFHSILSIPIAYIEFLFPNSVIFILQIVTVIAFVLYDIAVLFLLQWIQNYIKTDFKIECKNISYFCMSIFFLVNYGTGNPHRFLTSGGMIFIFSGAIALFGLLYVLKLFYEENYHFKHSIVAGVCFLCSFLIHPLSLIFMPFLFGTLLLMLTPYEKFNIFFFKILFQKNWKFYTACLIVFLIPLPILILSYYTPQEETSRIVLKYITEIRKEYSFSFLKNHFLQMIGFVIKQFAHLMLLSLFFLFFQKRIYVRSFVAIFLFVFISWYGFYLPKIGLLIYIDRISQFIAISMGGLLIFQKEHFRKNRFQGKWIQYLPFLVVAYIFTISSVRYIWNYVVQPNQFVLLTQNDMEIIQKIPNIAEKESIIFNNYYDAGIWIPTLIGYPITVPHIHFSQYYEWKNYKKILLSRNDHYGFVGEKCYSVYSCKNICKNQLILLRKEKSTFCKIKSD